MDFYCPELDEDPLPFVPPPVSSPEPDRQNDAEKIVTVYEVLKMNVATMNIELKTRTWYKRFKDRDEFKIEKTIEKRFL